MCDHPFENSIAISQLLPQLISSVRPISSQADCINPTLQPSSPDRNILLFQSETAKSPRAERKPTCFLSAGQSKCEAAGCKLGRLHCCCRVAATATSRSRLCWLRNNKVAAHRSFKPPKHDLGRVQSIQKWRRCAICAIECHKKHENVLHYLK